MGSAWSTGADKGKVSRRYKKVRKAQQALIEEKEDLAYETLKAQEEAGEEPELPDYADELNLLALPAHEFGSDTFLTFALKQKALWVKISQMVATREDIAPEPYTRKLKQCQDEMPPTKWNVVKRVVEKAYKAKLTDKFQEFDSNCLGAASIAQVHKATTLDGTKCVVKVQHLGVRELFLQDLKTFKWCLAQIAKSFGDEFNYAFLFDAWEEAIPNELDFNTEAQALLTCDANLKATQTGECEDAAKYPAGPEGGPATAETLSVGTVVEAKYKGKGDWYGGKISKVNGGTYDIAYDDGDVDEGLALHHIRFAGCPTFVDVIIPTPVMDLVTPRVLCMTFEEGVLLNNLAALRDLGVTDADKSVLLFTVAKAYGKMIFVDGFFQADPHPGNIMVQKQPDGSFKPVLLDFGLSENIPDHMRFGLSKVFMAAKKMSREMFVDGFQQLGPDLDRMRQYEAGDPVFAIWKNTGDWFEGAIVKSHGDGTYQVKFHDDGAVMDVRGRDITRKGRPNLITEFMKNMTRQSETKQEAQDRKAEFRKAGIQRRKVNIARSKKSKADKAEAEAWKAERKRNRAKVGSAAATFQALPKEWVFFGRVLSMLRATATQHDIKVDYRKAFTPFCEIALAEEEEILKTGGAVSSKDNPIYKGSTTKSKGGFHQLE